MSKTLAIHTLGVYSPQGAIIENFAILIYLMSFLDPFGNRRLPIQEIEPSEIRRFFKKYLPSSLSVNLPNCGWSLNVSIQMTSSLANRTMAKSSCLINLIFPVFSPVFLSTLQMMFLSVTSSMMACKCRTNCLPGHMILV